MENKNELATLPAADIAAVNPSMLLQMAVSKDLDITKLERLMDMQERWEKNAARKAFLDAIARFQSIVPPLEKSKLIEFTTSRGKTSYRFAPLGEIEAQIKSSMYECGLSKRWELGEDGGQIVCTCIISHRDGHSEKTIMRGPKDDSGGKNAIQQAASAVTYLQRYSMIAALGLTTADEDNDGAIQQSESRPETPATPDKPWLNETDADFKAAEAHIKAGIPAATELENLRSKYRVNKKHNEYFENLKAGAPAPKAKGKELQRISVVELMEYHRMNQDGLPIDKSVPDIFAIKNSVEKLRAGAVDMATVKSVYDLAPEVEEFLAKQVKK